MCMTEAQQHTGQAHSAARNRRLMQATKPTHAATGPSVPHGAQRPASTRNEFVVARVVTRSCRESSEADGTHRQRATARKRVDEVAP